MMYIVVKGRYIYELNMADEKQVDLDLGYIIDTFGGWNTDLL